MKVIFNYDRKLQDNRRRIPYILMGASFDYKNYEYGKAHRAENGVEVLVY